MAIRDETPSECGNSLLDDGVESYLDLIKNKDNLIRLITSMIESDALDVVNSATIDDFFSDLKSQRPVFNSWHEYAVPAVGEI